MAKKGSFSKVYDKNGDYADVEAVRFDGTRTVQMQGDVTASQTWNGDPSSPLTLNASIGAKKVTREKINDKAVGTAQIDDDAVGLTQIDDNAMTSTATAGDNRLITSGGVRTEIDNAVLNRGKDYPPMTPSQINAITETIPTGSKVHVTESGTITDGNIEVRAGEDLKYYRDGNTHYWYSLDGEFKLKQNQKSIQNLGTTKTITSLSQDENGEITASPSEIQRASTSQEGLVQLTDSHTSTSTTTAATPKNVKEAYDLANGKYSKPSGGIPKSDLASGVQASLDKADSAVQGVKLAGASSALTPDANNVVTVPNAVPTGTDETNGLMTAADKAKLDGIASGAEANVQSDWNQTNSSSDDYIKNKPTKLSDFTDDITQSNYIASGTDSDKPASGAAVAQAVAKSYVATVYSGGSTKSFKAIEFDMTGDTAANCLLGIIEVNEGGNTYQCMFDINAVYTVSSHTVGTVVRELCWIKNKTNKIKLAYSIDTTTDKLIIYVKNLNAWHSAQIHVLTAQVEGRNNLGYVTTFDNTSVTLPDSAVEFTELDSRDASWINSGTFGTDRIADDAITAAKVKDNETLPVNISGRSASATGWRGQISGTANSANTKRYVYIGKKTKSDYGCLIGMLTICSHTNSKDVYVIGSGWSNGNFGDGASVQRISSGGTDAPIKICLYNHEVTEGGTTYSELWCYIPTDSSEADFIFRELFNYNSRVTLATGIVNRAESAFTGTLTKCANSDSRNIAYSPTNTAKGSTSVPVYVKASGEIDACTDTFVNNIEYVANQSGGGGNLNKTINGTTTSVLAFMNDTEAVAIWADAKTAAANAS